MPDAADAAELVRAVRRVLDFARRGGLPSELEEAIAGDVVDALLELAAWRRGDMDPRRAKTLAFAARVARARAAGASIAELQERFGKSRSHVHWLLNVAKHRQTPLRDAAATR